jgi:uncharacterized phage protein (TIGR01671 family)
MREIKFRTNNTDVSVAIDYQYFGVKDRNGVEIKECDIVKYDDEDNENIICPAIGVVRWDSQKVGFSVETVQEGKSVLWEGKGEPDIVFHEYFVESDMTIDIYRWSDLEIIFLRKLWNWYGNKEAI